MTRVLSACCSEVCWDLILYLGNFDNLRVFNDFDFDFGRDEVNRTVDFGRDEFTFSEGVYLPDPRILLRMEGNLPIP